MGADRKPLPQITEYTNIKKLNKTMKLNFNETTLSVPESWADVCLSKYENCFVHNDYATPERRIELFAQLCGTTPQVLLGAPAEVLGILEDTLSFVYEQNFEPKPFAEIGGLMYLMPPSDELSLGEWVDAEGVLASGSPTKVADTLAIVCRPAGEKYDSKATDRRRELFRNLPCDKALPLAAFFLRRKELSEKISSRYSEAAGQASRLQEVINHFAENGAGTRWSQIWPKIRFYILTRYSKKLLSKFSAFFSTEWIRRLPKTSKLSLPIKG
jgi:hypothetical protein